MPGSSNKVSAGGGTSIVYNSAGAFTSYGSTAYNWNAMGQISFISTSGSTVGTYTYNASNQRTKKVAGGNTTHYVYGLGGLLYGEYDGSGALIREYVYQNDAPLAQIDAGSPEVLTYLHTDHLGTPKYGTNTGGTSVWAANTDPFGVGTPSGSRTVNLRMAGQYYDSESGLFYNWNRYYHPALGRYISSDPIGLEGGPNTFNYASVSPIMFVDPRGLDNLNIGIEPPASTAISDGKLNAAEGTGHTFAYITDDNGKVISKVSIGPTKPIDNQNKVAFVKGDLPATADWPTGGDIDVYSWPIEDSNLEGCKAAFEEKRNNPGNYSESNQCTNAATSLAGQCGINVPSGSSPVIYKDKNISFSLGDQPNPYGLKEQLDKRMTPKVITDKKGNGGKL